MSPSVASRAPDTTPHLFQSPALLTDAIKRLSAAVRDRQSVSSERKRADDASGGGSRGATNVFRIMDNLFIRRASVGLMVRAPSPVAWAGTIEKRFAAEAGCAMLHAGDLADERAVVVDGDRGGSGVMVGFEGSLKS